MYPILIVLRLIINDSNELLYRYVYFTDTEFFIILNRILNAN